MQNHDDNDRGEMVRSAREKRGWTQAELARRVGGKQQTIGKIEKGDVKHSSLFPGIARELGIEPQKLMPELATGRSEAPLLPDTDIYRIGRQDFPVHTSAEGGPGEIVVSSDPVAWVVRPTPLVGVTRSYGIIIVGESMVPEFRPGDTALINPHLPPERGATFVFYRERDGEVRATIKHLVRWTEAVWHLQQWNPPKGQKADFTLPRAEWNKAHRVVGKYSK